MMTILLVLLISYVVTGVSAYVYAVVKSREVLGFWNWKIDDGYIGICEYPKWLMGWMYWASNKLLK